MSIIIDGVLFGGPDVPKDAPKKVIKPGDVKLPGFDMPEPEPVIDPRDLLISDEEFANGVIARFKGKTAVEQDTIKKATELLESGIKLARKKKNQELLDDLEKLKLLDVRELKHALLATLYKHGISVKGQEG